MALEVVSSTLIIHPIYCDPLAQSVEHLTFNQGVPRSSRGWITIYKMCIRDRDKSKYNYDDDLSLLISKKKKKQSKGKDGVFRNNYKNYQYDYEEDFYEPL